MPTKTAARSKRGKQATDPFAAILRSADKVLRDAEGIGSGPAEAADALKWLHGAAARAAAAGCVLTVDTSDLSATALTGAEVADRLAKVSAQVTEAMGEAQVLAKYGQAPASLDRLTEVADLLTAAAPAPATGPKVKTTAPRSGAGDKTTPVLMVVTAGGQQVYRGTHWGGMLKTVKTYCTANAKRYETVRSILTGQVREPVFAGECKPWAIGEGLTLTTGTA